MQYPLTLIGPLGVGKGGQNIVLARLFEERERENVKVFGASNVEACNAFNIHNTVLILGMGVLYGSNTGVVGSNLKQFLFLYYLF